MYSILDIESTGGNQKGHRITEIAIYVHDGNQVVDEFHSLVNPERKIPSFVRRLTGISNEMVAEAPYFYEIARDIVEKTAGTTIVAHNVAFDYPFLRREFNMLGYNFQRSSLCTLQLSRKVLPGYQSYSLGKLCQSLGISLNGRHRAAGDAEATVKLFELLLDKTNGAFTEAMNGKNGIMIPKKIAPGLEQKIEEIPSETGIYYLYDGSGKLSYIGKSKNIKNRVKQHIRGANSFKAREMSANIQDVDYKVTGSELAALINEAIEIKQYKPLYNRQQRRSAISFGLFMEKDTAGYHNLAVKKLQEHSAPLIPFKTKKEGWNWLNNFVENAELCQVKCGLYTTSSACFHYQTGRCRGACCGKESPENYNARLEDALDNYMLPGENYLLIDKSYENAFKTVVKVNNGSFEGIANVPAEVIDKKDTGTIEPYLNFFTETRDIRRIVSYFSLHDRVEQVVFY